MDLKCNIPKANCPPGEWIAALGFVVPHVLTNTEFSLATGKFTGSIPLSHLAGRGGYGGDMF